ncbi:MFS transporter [Desertibacillus haloalkaliphilus]|uniref:MFS transporter n=1 Tax=Desertibacillus haloalkaliphilus TaxID=1328930 RepID=UPI001C267EC6|nr:MFS transporter [Desertibacillus haloalkaliphilus]MBU8908776.1 MFS transporter [Desertibacillus haloalkaliphilus]
MPNLKKPMHEPISYKGVTATFTFLAITIVANIYMMIPLTNDLHHLFTASTTPMAWASSIFMLFYAFGLLIFGPLSLRFRPKQIILFGLVALIICTSTLAFVSTIHSLLIIRALQGFFAASFAPVAFTYLLEQFPPEKRLLPLALMNSGFLAAGIFGQFMGASLLLLYDWTIMFLIFSAIYLIGFFLVVCYVPQTKTPKLRQNLLSTWTKMFALILKRPLRYTYLITITLLLSFVSYYASVGEHLKVVHQTNEQQILFFRACGLIGMFVIPFLNDVSKKFGYINLLIIGLCASIAGLAVELFFTPLGASYISSILFVSGIAVVIPVIVHLIGTLDHSYKSEAVSLYTFILLIGAALGSIIASLTSPKTMYMIVIALLVMDLMVVSLLKRYL